MSTAIAVLDRFIERSLRPSYAHQFATYLGDANNSAYRLPSVTLGSAITTQGRSAPTRPTVATQSLLVDQRAKFNHAVDDLEARQLLNGAYVMSLADRMFNAIMGEHDDAMYAAMIEACVANAGLNTAAFSGGNVTNGALTAVSKNLIARFEASLSSPGNLRDNFAYFASPVAHGLIRALFDAQIGSVPVLAPALGSSADQVTINGIPLLLSNALPDQIEVTATASTITSNVCVATVPAGHGLQVGMSIYTTGGSANVASGSEVAISAATATTVTYAQTASDGSNGTPTLICPAAVAMLAPRDKIFWAGDVTPSVKIVDDAEDAGGQALQAYSTYGRAVIEGDARMLLVV